MCGIVGMCSFDKELPIDVINSMLDRIKHRGPDDQGIYRDLNVNLGMRRLEILDKPGGKQPFNIDNRFEVTFNGEIYNHLSLRKLVPSYNWKSRSDTETIGVLFQYLGIKTFSLLQGMFAICIWDKDQKQLIIARDRFGEKPFFYKFEDDIFIYGSTCDSLDEFNARGRNLSESAIKTYLCFGYLPPNVCINSKTYSLNPGFFAIFNQKGFVTETYLSQKEKIKDQEVWQSDEKVTEDAKILEMVVGDQLIADVPVGIFLSGGFDSGLISFIASKKREDIHSFSALFTNNRPDFNRAKQMAYKLNLNHHEVVIKDEDILTLIEKQAIYFDEPFGDSASLAMLALSEFAKTKVGVALSGDGADELFGGYRWRYLPFALTEKMRAFTKPIPITSLHLISILCRFTHKEKASNLFESLINIRRFEKALNPFMSYLNFNYPHLSSLQPDFANTLFNDLSFLNLESVMNFDKKIYLPGDILVKTDRASMANSLEVRSPYLDQRILGISENLRTDQLISRSDSKIYLKSMGKALGFEYNNDFPKTGLGGNIEKLFLSPGVKNHFQRLIDSNFGREIRDLIGSQLFEIFSNARTQSSWNLYMLLNWSEHRQIESVGN